ncbi:MAG TPA: DUF6094 domain-containing protein, partial [Candidatus Binatia bacterium]|nr:DUF6094 domain-containing protein [Candidatus Binatia bacterium]
PPHMAEVTASWFTPLPAGICGRLFDPCAGEGEIASLLGKLLNCETWGCELFPYRAEKTATRMDRCTSVAWESCSLTDESVTVLWLNPPYDDDRHGQEKRLELAFLKSTTPKLAREVLRGAELDDLQSLFAVEMRVSNSPMGCPTEDSPVLVPVQPRTWDEWLNERNMSGRLPTTRRSGKQGNVVAPGQLSIWSTFKEK